MTITVLPTSDGEEISVERLFLRPIFLGCKEIVCNSPFLDHFREGFFMLYLIYRVNAIAKIMISNPLD